MFSISISVISFTKFVFSISENPNCLVGSSIGAFSLIISSFLRGAFFSFIEYSESNAISESTHLFSFSFLLSRLFSISPALFKTSSGSPASFATSMP